MRYLRTYNEAIEDVSGSMADKNLIDYNASLMKLQHDIEIYAEELPFEMNNIEVNPIPGIKLGGSYWYYQVVFNYNNEEMNNTIDTDFLMGTVNLDGYVDLSDEPIAWIDMIKEQCDTALVKFARKYDLEFKPADRKYEYPLKVLINMEDSSDHNIKYTAVFKKKR